MICFPNAKINLGLSVKEKRIDNMHNIETCLLPIPLCDILEIKQADRFSLKILGLDIEGNERENSIVVAWEALLPESNKVQPVSVLLYKNIPAGSGLGGGSSDAAFFIKAINTLYSLDFTNEFMESLALEIGSDCPFFIQNKPVIATGIGNVFNEIKNPISNKYITVVFPKFSISTQSAYSKVVPSGDQSIDSVLQNGISEWKNLLRNDFENNVFIDFPELLEIKRLFYENGAEYASLTGSGSSIYAISLLPIKIEAIDADYNTWSTFIH